MGGNCRLGTEHGQLAERSGSNEGSAPAKLFHRSMLARGAYPMDSASEQIDLESRLGQDRREMDRPTTAAQRIGGVDSLSARQRRSDQSQHLVPHIRPP